MKTMSLQRPATANVVPAQPRRLATIVPVQRPERSRTWEKRMFIVMMTALTVFALAFATYVVRPAMDTIGANQAQEWLANGP